MAEAHLEVKEDVARSLREIDPMSRDEGIPPHPLAGPRLMPRLRKFAYRHRDVLKTIETDLPAEGWVIERFWQEIHQPESDLVWINELYFVVPVGVAHPSDADEGRYYNVHQVEVVESASVARPVRRRAAFEFPLGLRDRVCIRPSAAERYRHDGIDPEGYIIRDRVRQECLNSTLVCYALASLEGELRHGIAYPEDLELVGATKK